MVEAQLISIYVLSTWHKVHKSCRESSSPCLLSHVRETLIQGLSDAGGKVKTCPFSQYFPIFFLSQEWSLSCFSLTEFQARIYLTDISWGNPLGVATAAMAVTFNVVFILPLGTFPWVKSQSLPNTNSWHQCWCLIHLASSLCMGSSRNTSRIYQQCFTIISVITML